MITALELKEFRGVRETAKPIPLKKFNILIGRNNSGKTTILEALALLPSPGTSVPLMKNYPSIDFVSQLHNNRKDSLVYGYAGKAIARYFVEDKKFELNIETTGTAYFVAPDATEFDDWSEEPSDSPPYRTIKSTGEPKTLKKMSTCFYSNKVNEEILRHLLVEDTWRIVEKTKAHNLVLREVINPSITETFTEVVRHFLAEQQMMLLEARKEFPDGTSAYIRLSELGDGVQKAIIPLLWFQAASPSLVLWDDLEASMHPSLVENILRWLAHKDWQVVISTHSIDVLYAVTNIEPADAHLIILRKSAEDVLDHQTFTIDEVQTLIDSGTDPRKLADLLALR